MPLVKFIRKQIWDGRMRNIGDELMVEQRYVPILRRLEVAEMVDMTRPGPNQNANPNSVKPKKKLAEGEHSQEEALQEANKPLPPEFEQPEQEQERNAIPVSSSKTTISVRGNPAPASPKVEDEKKKRDEEQIRQAKDMAAASPPVTYVRKKV